MSVIFRPFDALDAVRIDVQDSQRVQAGRVQHGVTMPEAVELERSGPAWTCESAGRILAVFGLMTLFRDDAGNPVHAQAWVIMADDIAVSAKRALTRKVAAILAESPLRRIDAFVHADNPSEAQWARLCGLRHCASLTGFGAMGETVDMYERVRL